MQTPDFSEDPSPAEDVLTENGHDNTSFDSNEPYVPPRIPLGLPPRRPFRRDFPLALAPDDQDRGRKNEPVCGQGW